MEHRALLAYLGATIVSAVTSAATVYISRRHLDKKITEGRGARGVQVTAVRGYGEIIVTVRDDKHIPLRDLTVRADIASYEEDDAYVAVVPPYESASFRYLSPPHGGGYIAVTIQRTVSTCMGETSLTDLALITLITPITPAYA